MTKKPILYAVRPFVLDTEHLGHARSEDVGVEQSHIVAQSCQGDGEVGGDGALAHAALSGADGDDVLHPGQEFAHLRARRVAELGGDVYLHVLAHGVVDLCLCRLDGGLEERVGLAWEDERDAHFVPVDAGGVGQHFTLDDVLLCARVDDFLQGFRDEFWI